MEEQSFDVDRMDQLMQQPFEQLAAADQEFVLSVFDSGAAFNAARTTFAAMHNAVKEDVPNLEPDPGILLRMHNTMAAKATSTPKKIERQSLLPGLSALLTGKFAAFKVGVVAVFCLGLFSVESGINDSFYGYGIDSLALDVSSDQKVWHDSCRIDTSSLLP